MWWTTTARRQPVASLARAFASLAGRPVGAGMAPTPCRWASPLGQSSTWRPPSLRAAPFHASRPNANIVTGAVKAAQIYRAIKGAEPTYTRFGGGKGGGGGGFGGRGGGRQKGALTPGQRRVRLYMTSAALAGGGVVWYSSREEIPFTHRMHAIMVTTDMERQLGEQTFAQIKQEAMANRTLLPPHHPATRAVERVGRRLASVASSVAQVGGGYTAHMEGLNWEFVVIDDAQVNAFVVPGGKVVVYTGLLRLMKAEKELAAVLAHEVAHVLARHVAERITRTQAASLAQTLAYAALGIPIPAGAFELALFLPNSRKAETEADVIGMRLAALACYDPAAAATVFAKLGEAEAAGGGPHVPTMLRTHPLSEDRVARVHAELPAANELYSRAGCRAPRSMFKQFVDVLAGQEAEVEHPPMAREIAPGVFVLVEEED